MHVREYKVYTYHLVDLKVVMKKESLAKREMGNRVQAVINMASQGIKVNHAYVSTKYILTDLWIKR